MAKARRASARGRSTPARRAAATAARPRAAKKRSADREARARDLPVREWDRGAELVKLFVATGYIANTRPQSMLIMSEPGTGKTELLERFRPNRHLSYHSDLTVKQLYPVLKRALRGQVTHIVCTELQKLFQRKAAVAENCLGTMVQAMEEGVQNVSVGPDSDDFNGARIGVIGAITNGTLKKKREQLSEMGFLSRAAVFPWHLPPEEERDILSRISEGDVTDLLPIFLSQPEKRIIVEIPTKLSRELEHYVWDRSRGRALRFFNRLRALAQASAVLEGRDVVTTRDIQWVLAFDVYWEKCVEA